MSYAQTGVLHSVDPVTKERRGFVEVGVDAAGTVIIRTVRGSLDATMRFREAMALRVAELISRAACGPRPDASETRQAARKVTATHLEIGHKLVDVVRDPNMSRRDATRAIASALTTELRRGVALAQGAGADSALLEALTIGDEPGEDRKPPEAANGLAG